MKKSFLCALSVAGLMAPLAADQVISPVQEAHPIGQISYSYDDCCDHHFDPCFSHECCEFFHGGNPEWGGFYAGIFIGYGFGETTNILGLDKLKPRGWLGGGELGWNYQLCNWVLGIEADIAATDIRESSIFTGQSTQYVGTVRARLGYDFCDNLLYATGGFAYGRSTYDFLNINRNSITKSRTGWTVGGGVERKISCNWSLKAEYLYYQFKKFDETYDDGIGDTVAIDWKTAIHTVRVGLNYHF